MKSERVTIRDVARHADVAISTVSRALNGSPAISSATTERVRESARALGYTPDQIGRALRRKSTSSLGLVVPNIVNPFFPALIQSIEIAARGLGWTMLLADAQDDIDIERETIELLVGRRVDAIVISPLHQKRSAPALLKAAKSTSIVQVDRRCSVALAHVGVDQQAAMVGVLNHLLQTGRRHIVFVGVDSGEWSGDERRSAFRSWARVNLESAHTWLGASTLDFGRAAARQILEAEPEVDAVACCNDILAMGVLLELQEHGIDVPGQVAITGFDNSLLGVVSRPTLTTVAQPFEALAQRAVAIANSEEEELPSQYLYHGDLILRDSSLPKNDGPSVDAIAE